MQCAHGGSLTSTSRCVAEFQFTAMEFQLDPAKGHHTGTPLSVKEVKERQNMSSALAASSP